MRKTIIITGSTDGIGKLAAIQLAKEGHNVYLHGRSSEKLNNTVEEVRKISKNPSIKGFIADFSDLAAVKNMAKTIWETVSTIDVLINNAGVFKSSQSSNKDGFDLRFVVNYLAPFVLTNELIPLLNNSAAPRLINLSSAAQTTVNQTALLEKSPILEQSSYAQSKLALTMWSFYFAKKYPTINTIAVNPGSLLNTKMVQEAYGQFWSSAEKGATILYDLATLSKYENASGKYFDNDRGFFNKAHPDAYDDVLISELIKLTEEMIDSSSI